MFPGLKQAALVTSCFYSLAVPCSCLAWLSLHCSPFSPSSSLGRTPGLRFAAPTTLATLAHPRASILGSFLNPSG